MKRSRSVILATIAALAAGGTAVYIAGSASAAAACSEAWSAEKVYTGGMTASQNGHNWQAKWWTQNQPPAANSQDWNVWKDAAECGEGGPEPTTEPTPEPTTEPTAEPTTAPPTSEPTEPPATTPPTTEPPATVPPGDGSLPKHFLTGYWHNFANQARELKLADVPDTYDLIAVAFAEAAGTSGAVTFTVDPGLASSVGGYTDEQFKADVTALHSRGKKVIISVGGELGNVNVSDAASAGAFADSVFKLMQTYGFDGVDIDLEHGLNPDAMSTALKSLRAKAGDKLIITMAPQTVDMQSTSGSYFQLATKIKDILTVVHMQYYNSGTMNTCTGSVAAPSTVDFLVGLACIQLQGGLRDDQVALGLPSSAGAAGSGVVAPSVVNAALDCLAKGENCGSIKPAARYPGIRGAMTWSINWDVTNGGTFADGVAPHLSTLP